MDDLPGTPSVDNPKIGSTIYNIIKLKIRNKYMYFLVRMRREQRWDHYPFED
jgi:hypothetical protein